MAEETNEWELAQDFSSNEGDIKKKNTEKSPLIFQTGSTQSQSLGSDGLGTSKIDTWESALTPEQKKSFVPIKEEIGRAHV